MHGYERLLCLLDQTVGAQKKLLELEHRKTSIITHGTVQEMDEVLLLEQSLIMKVAGLEERREAMQKEMGLAGMTLREIVNQYDSENASGFTDRLHALSSVLLELQKTNRLNMSILKSRLSVLNRLMVITGMKEPVLTYEKTEHTHKAHVSLI